MYNRLLRFVAFAALLSLGAGIAAAHGSKQKVAGPNGGRIMTAFKPHAEFFVTADRKVKITFLDEKNRTVTPGAQVVTVTSGDRAAPVRLAFTRDGDALVSTAALPAGKDLPTVVQIKADAAAKTVTEKFNVDLAKCPECKLGEYACICAH
jgi:hypothetical protein